MASAPHTQTHLLQVSGGDRQRGGGRGGREGSELLSEAASDGMELRIQATNFAG